MKKQYHFKVMLLALTLITQFSFSQQAQKVYKEQKQVVSEEQKKQLIQNHSSQIGFEENKGQVTGEDAERVNFILKDNNMSMFLLDNGIAYQFNKTHYPESYKGLDKSIEPDDLEEMKKLAKDIKVETYRMDITLVGANANPKITTEGKSKDYTQYYNHDALNVHRFNKVTYHNVYPNIDWVLYKSDNKIKYDFVVHPGGNPNQIKLKTSWVEDLQLNKDGSVTLKNRMGEVTENTPISFQGESEIETQFKVFEDGIISFDVEEYNSSETLVVDPALIWTTYYGGSDTEDVHSTSTDQNNNVFLAGNTYSTNNISSGGHQVTSGGGYDAFLAKFNSSGVRQWATYYGGSAMDQLAFCATDLSGNVYLSGTTQSSTNISTTGAHQESTAGDDDAYLVKFNSLGTRLWGTYYGGSLQDLGQFCATDDLGNVYLSGYTYSTTNIASGGHQNSLAGSRDAFLVKFNSNGIRDWGSYYGGSSSESGTSCATDGSGNIYLAGKSSSVSNIASGGHQNTYGGGYADAYLVKFNSSGVLQWGTYYGGSDREWDGYCATDNNDNVFLSSSTNGFNNISSSGHQNSLGGLRDAFLVKFNSSGIRQWGTFYGGSSNEMGYECTTDANGNVFLTGYTFSTNNISLNGFQNSNGGGADAFLAKFNDNGVREWATYYGNSGYEVGVSCATDGNGSVYMSGLTESTSGMGMVLAGVHQTSHGGGTYDGFLIKFEGAVCVAPDQPTTISGNNTLCEGETETYSVTSDPNATSYTWVLPSGWSGASTTNSITATAGATGGTIEVIAENGCGVSSSQTLSVTVNALPTVVANGTASICEGESTTLTASGATNYTWDNGAGSGSSVSVSPTANTTYTVTGTDGNGCENTDDVTVTVNSLPTVAASGTATICEGVSTTLTASGATNYSWDNGAGSGSSVSVSPNTTTTYTVTGTDGNNCVNTDEVIITVNSLPTVATSADETICDGDNVTISASGANSYSWDNSLGTGSSHSVSPNTTTTYTVTGTDVNNCENTDEVIITVNSLPSVTTSADEAICNGDNVTISVSGANSYSWDNSLGTGSSHSVSPNTTTTYTVTGTDVNNCENTDQVTITVNGLPTVLASTDETICDGDNVAISASGANSYSWDNSLGTGSSHSVSPNSTTTYTVTGTDGNGCENTDDVTVTVNSLPTVVASSDETICDGDNVTISANGANSYSWDNSLGTGSSHSVSPNTTTTYTVTGTDGNNCENSDEVTITVLESPVVDAGNAISICPDESATLAATGALSYSWDNGLGTGSVQTVTPSSTTTYTVTGTGGNGCTNTDEVTVTVQIVPDNGVTLSTDELTITAVSSGIDYTWVDCNNNFEPVPGETDQSFTHSQSGSFAVIVSNNGCADTSDCIVVDDLSVSSNKINPSITLVPNPTNSITKIVTDAQINKVQVVDFSGKIIEVPQSETKTELDFTNLSRGTYFINIETSYGSYVERVVVM